jgi:hypothetical protein
MVNVSNEVMPMACAQLRRPQLRRPIFKCNPINVLEKFAHVNTVHVRRRMTIKYTGLHCWVYCGGYLEQRQAWTGLGFWDTFTRC